jgi:hypothetical protein
MTECNKMMTKPLVTPAVYAAGVTGDALKEPNHEWR